MVVLQEHVCEMLERTDITTKKFLAIRSPVRHAIALMIAAYNRKDQEEGWKIFQVCLRRLADKSGRPSCEENIDPLAYLRVIHHACECLLQWHREYYQYSSVSPN